MKYGALVLAAWVAITSCEAPGERVAEERVLRPNEISDFGQLYAQNCAGCHGVAGQGALTVALDNPAYLAIAGDAVIRRITVNGVPGTAMPGFAQKAGGFLTDAQIDIIVSGIRTHWAKPDTIGEDKLPAYSALVPGDPARGQNVFVTFCSSCHGPDGRGGSIVDNSYLALVSDQHLRTVTIAGIPSLDAPDWRSDVPGRPLSESDVTDVVAWLSTQRLPLTAQANPSISTRKGDSR